MPVILGVLIAGFAVTVPSLLLLFRVFSRTPGGDAEVAAVVAVAGPGADAAARAPRDQR